jgi:hypothetical protein
MKLHPSVFALGLISLLHLSLGQSWTMPVLADQSTPSCVTDTAYEAAIISTTRGKAIRQGNLLKIKTGRGAITFQNICSTENTLPNAYELTAYFADVRYFLVRNTSIEYNDFTLINERTGAKTTLYNTPVFSPDRQRFTAMVIDELNGLTSIEIYRLTTTGLRREYKNTTVHSPNQPHWQDNSTIAFQRTLTLSSEPIPAILKRKKGVWKLT